MTCLQLLTMLTLHQRDTGTETVAATLTLSSSQTLKRPRSMTMDTATATTMDTAIATDIATAMGKAPHLLSLLLAAAVEEVERVERVQQGSVNPNVATKRRGASLLNHSRKTTKHSKLQISHSRVNPKHATASCAVLPVPPICLIKLQSPPCRVGSVPLILGHSHAHT